MGKYDRETLKAARKTFGSLLQIEEGRIAFGTAKSLISGSVEFRTKGLILFSRKNDFSETVAVADMDNVRLIPGMAGESADEVDLIVIQTKGEGVMNKVFLELEYPEFLVTGIDRIIEEQKKKQLSEKQTGNLSEILKELKCLLNEGLVTEEEYLERKSAVLKRLTEG